MSDEFVKRLVLSCVLAAVAAPGQVAAQTAKAAKAAKAEESVGRLFFTPAQRASLDIARTRRAPTSLATEGAEETATPVAQTITYGGMVRRSDGKSTVWLNNRPINDQELVGGPIIGRVRPDGGVSLQVPQSGRGVDLKPGQSVELLSGAIEEGYSRKPLLPEPKPTAKPVAEAKGTKPAPSGAANAEREREERQREAAEAAVSRALQETAGAKPGAAPPAAQPAR